MKTLEEIHHRFQLFTHGVRIVMLINRAIGNSNKGSRRWINKIITTNEHEWLEAVSKLLDLQKHLGDPDIRLYACVNDRKIDSAISLFKHRQIDLQEDMKVKFYSKINNTFSSCLMKPENKISKYFLLDIDGQSSVDADTFISDHLIKVVKTYPSKSGWHYIVEPFNIKLAEGYKGFEIKKDGLLLLNWME